jgi:hypothetical protein
MTVHHLSKASLSSMDLGMSPVMLKLFYFEARSGVNLSLCNFHRVLAEEIIFLPYVCHCTSANEHLNSNM